MYCSTCGAEVPGELNYCNRCGASLNAPASVPAPTIAAMSFNKLALIIGLTLIFGLGIVFGGAGELAKKGVNPVAITWMAIFGLATLFGISAMFIRLWSQISGINSQPQRQPQPNRRESIYEPARPSQLPPRPANFGSVTENTTRTLEPVLRDTMEAEGKK